MGHHALDTDALVVVAGGGGFIGGHLVAELRRRGHRRVRAVDVKPPAMWYQRFPDVDNRVLDLRDLAACREAVGGARSVFNLACDMGGMGFIELHKAECMLSVLINTHMLMACHDERVERFFFSSSACVYAAEKQTTADVLPLREADAYPAMPEDGYGWEKLFSERMCRHFSEDFGLQTRIARYHNVYGPHGTYDGGREKAPAAICRKVVQAQLSGSGEIAIWGDGEQTRSFTYIDDCLHGTLILMESDVAEPLNVGSDQLVTINQLVDIVEEIAGVKLRRRYQLEAPKGVRGRNSDNTLIRERLSWAPSTRLETGMRRTYEWIHAEMTRSKEAAGSLLVGLPTASHI
jgi:nucleoside-diphosphate-sugar epimerase